MMIEKQGSHKRALRRQHDKRKKAWVRKTLGHYFMDTDDPSARRVGIYSQRRRFAPVSCAAIPDAISTSQQFKNAARCLTIGSQTRKAHNVDLVIWDRRTMFFQFINVALGSCGENYSQMYALLDSGEISKDLFDEIDKRHYGVENKLINLAKSLARKMKTGQDWNSDYKVT